MKQLYLCVIVIISYVNPLVLKGETGNRSEVFSVELLSRSDFAIQDTLEAEVDTIVMYDFDPTKCNETVR